MSEPDASLRPHHPRRLHLELSPLERARLWVEIAAFVAAGAWAIYVFIYQTHVAPLLEAPHVVVAADVRRVGQTPNAYVERARINFTNDGHTAVDIAAYAINLFGFKGTERPFYVEQRRHGTIIGASFANFSERNNVYVGGNANLNAAGGGPSGRHIILQPGDTVQTDVPAFVPRGRFDALELITSFMFVRYPFSDPVPVQLRRQKDDSITIQSNSTLQRAFGVTIANVFGL